VIGRIFFGSRGLRAGWSLLLFAAILAAQWAIAIVIARRVMHVQSLHPKALYPLPTLVSDVILLATVVVATAIMARIERRSLLSYGFSSEKKLHRLGSGLLVGIVAMSALVLALWLAHFLVFEGRALHGVGILTYAAMWGLAFLLVGFFEESVFRGYALFTLARGLNFFWAALILSTVFGLVHAGNAGESPFGLVGAGLIGLIFCFSLWLTGSLWWAVGVHAAWDWTQSYYYGVADSGLRAEGHLFQTHPAGPPIWSGGSTGPEASIFVLPLLVLIALGLWLAWGRKTEALDRSRASV
jgi:membrane protease YdiL (CAAX protease family)